VNNSKYCNIVKIATESYRRLQKSKNKLSTKNCIARKKNV